MAVLASLVVRVGADIANFTSDMNRASAISKRNSQKILRTFKRMGVGVTAIMAIAVKQAVEFEKAMDEVSTLVGDTTNMDKLTNSVRAVSREFGQAPVEQAKALYQIISAGAETAAEQMTLLTASNKLAIGGVTEVSIAADALTTILNAYSLEASQATDISDLLFVGMKAGKTTIEEMGLSIGTVATIAAQTGVGIDELVAGVATLTKSGISTSEAMSGLRGVLSAVLKQSGRSVNMANELGVAFNAQALEAKGLAKFLDDIQVAAGGDAEKLQKLFGRVEGLTAVMSLGANGAEEFNSILEQTGQRAGETDKAFGKMAQGSAFQLDRLKVSIGLIAEAIGAKLLPGVNLFADVLVRMLTPIKLIAESTSDAARATRQLGDAMRDNAIAKYTELIANSRTAYIDLDGQINILKNDLANETTVFGLASAASKKMTQQVTDLQQQQSILVKGIVAATKALKANDKMTKAAVKEKSKQNAITKTVTRSVEDLTSAYNSMINKLFPLIAIENSYKDQIEDLDELLDSGKISQEMYNEALDRAAENFRLASNAAKGLDDSLEFIEVTAKRMPDVVSGASKVIVTSMTGAAAVIENSFKRLDDTFASFWQNLVKNGKFSLKSIKDLFLDTIAQLLNAAITQPIVMRIGAALTGGLASGAASAAGGSIFGGTAGLLTPSNGAGLVGGIAGFAVGSNLGGGGTGSQAGAAIGAIGLGLFGGVVGGIIGGPLGAMVGKAIGAFVGGVLGGIVGGLFDRDPRISVGGSAASVSAKANRSQFVDTDLGGFFIGNAAGGQSEFKAAASKAIADFDNAIASFVNNNQLEKITAALKTWSITLKKEGVTIENILGSRFSTILGTFSQTIQDYVNQFDGLEDQTAALAKYVTALNTVGATIAAFADSDIAQVLADRLANAAKTSTQRLTDMAGALTDLFANFDNTPEQLDQISQLVDARYRGELEYLAAVDSLVKGIAASIEAQQNRIREAVEGPRSFEQILSDAQALFASLAGAGSPEEIARTVSSIQALVDRAFGGLDQAGQASQAATLISFLDQVQRAAEERANILAQQVIEQGMVLREQAEMFAQSIGAPLDLNVQATQDVSAAIVNQTDILVGEAQTGHENQVSIRQAIDRLAESFDRLVDGQGRIGFEGG